MAGVRLCIVFSESIIVTPHSGVNSLGKINTQLDMENQAEKHTKYHSVATVTLKK